MDPNTGKKGMFNKLSKQQAMRLLKKETIKRKTVSFYKYVILDHPDKLRDELYAAWKDLGVLGRIYLAQEGINAQLSVPINNWDAFRNNLYSKKDFLNMPIKIAIEDDGLSFFKLTIFFSKLYDFL